MKYLTALACRTRIVGVVKNKFTLQLMRHIKMYFILFLRLENN